MLNFIRIKNKTLLNLILFLVVLIVCFVPIKKVEAMSLNVHIPEKYTNVKAGERLYFEVEIRYPENLSRKDLRLEYQIVEGDKVISESKVLKAIETQASFMDYIVIPEVSKSGLHKINLRLSDYENMTQEVYATFNVASTLDQMKVYFFILIGSIVLLGVVVFFQIRKMIKLLVSKTKNKNI